MNNTKNNNPNNQLTTFNKDIKVTVSVDSIAQQLLDTIKDDEKHRFMIVNATIGSLLEADKISYLYNALNGYPSNINFEVGNYVKIDKNKLYSYSYEFPSDGIHAVGGTDSKRKHTRVNIERATVISINPYKSKKLLVEFNVKNNDGSLDNNTEWIEHTYCHRLQDNGDEYDPSTDYVDEVIADEDFSV